MTARPLEVVLVGTSHPHVPSWLEAARALEVELDGTRPSDTAARLAAALRDALGLNVPLRAVPLGTLPRFEMKAKRFVIER